MPFIKKTSILAVLALLVVALLPSSVITLAQDSGGNALGISPTRTEMTVDRGQSQNLSLQLRNLTNTEVIAKAYLNDFEADGNSGNPKLIIDEKIERTSSSLAEFLVGLQDVALKPNETKDIELSVQIPEQAAPGAYYGAIRYTSTPKNESDQGFQVSLNASVSSLVLVEVPGDITEKIEVTSVKAYRDTKSGSLFIKQPNKVGIEIKNLGNSFSKPFGSVNIKDTFGKQVYSYELNDTNPRGNILPNSSRLFINDIYGIKLPGRYTISANISHGRGGEILNVNSSFWYLPLWFVLVVVGIVVAIAALGFALYRRYIGQSVAHRRRRK